MVNLFPPSLFPPSLFPGIQENQISQPLWGLGGATFSSEQWMQVERICTDWVLMQLRGSMPSHVHCLPSQMLKEKDSTTEQPHQGRSPDAWSTAYRWSALENCYPVHFGLWYKKLTFAVSNYCALGFICNLTENDKMGNSLTSGLWLKRLLNQ